MRQLTLAAVAVWLGAMGFFAFVIAPAAFSVLDREAAGRFVSAVFPRYYAMGLALGLVATAALVYRIWELWSVGFVPLPQHSPGLAAATLGIGLTLYAGAVVLPAAQAAREAARAAGSDPAAAAGFARLHRLSSILNVIVMVSGILVVVIETVRRR